MNPEIFPLSSRLIRSIAIAAVLIWAGGAIAGSPSSPSEVQAQRAWPAISSGELRFEENVGQMDPAAQFFVRGLNHKLFLTPQGPVFSFRGHDGEHAAVRLSFLDANPGTSHKGMDRLEGHSNYLRGPQQVARAFSYAKALYEGVYPGVDLVYYGTAGKLEYDFILAPGVDPSVIRMRFEGADSISIGDNGDLLARVAGSDLRQLRPVVYQEIGGERKTVRAHYALRANGEIGVSMGNYDTAHPLVVDPILDFSSYLGRDEDEAANAVAVDADGNVYVTGSVESSDFPVSANAFLTNFGGDDSDAFVSKFRPDGTGVEFSTFLGSESDDVGSAIAVDSDGNIYVAGYTKSTAFPVDGFQMGFAGEEDCFVTKLAPDGSSAVFSTYLGDGDEDRCTSIAVDSDHNVYVAGFTRSLDFPLIDGSFQAVNGGGRDAFVAKLSADGGELVYSTFLGGGGDDLATGLAVDGDGAAYVVGDTKSVNFPLSNDAQQTVRGGDQDGFLAKLSADGATLVYASFLGGSALDVANAVALDSSNNIYVAGKTDSADFSLSAEPFQNIFAGGDEDGFLIKFDSSGREIRYATFLGGDESDSATGVAVDGAGNAVVVGVTSSENFFLTDNAVLAEPRGEEDAFVIMLNTSGTAALHSSYFGGMNDDRANGVAVDAAGNIYFAGSTKSDNFPLSQDAFQTTFNDGGITDILQTPTEAFVAKLQRDESDTPLISVSGANFLAHIAAGSIVSAFGIGLAPDTANAEAVPLPTDLAGVTVQVTDSTGAEFDVPLFFVSPDQINFFLPEEVAAGEATVTVSVDGAEVATGNFLVRAAAPGLFTMNASGEGVAAAVVMSVGPDDEIVTQPAFSGDVASGFVTEPVDISDSGETVLVLFATGLRGASDVTVTIDGEPATVNFSGPQEQFVGLDQVNVVLDPSLRGRGEVEVTVTADGTVSNTVLINIR